MNRIAIVFFLVFLGLTPHYGSAVAGLNRFADCQALLQYYQTQALPEITESGLSSFTGFFLGGFGVSAGLSVDSGDFSGTNVQEQGVDETDIVKTDGQYLYTLVHHDKLVVSKPDSGGIRHLASLQLPQDGYYQGLLLAGSRLLVTGSAWINQASVVRLVIVDLGDPGQPEIVRQLDSDGELLGARMTETTVRIVIDSGPLRFAWHYPANGLKLDDTPDSKALNIGLVENSNIHNWLPQAIVTDPSTGERQQRSLLACGDVYRPDQPEGFRTVTVLSFDLSGGDFETLQATGLVANGSLVYASPENLYVATKRYEPVFFFVDSGTAPSAEETVIHKFSFQKHAQAYEASGQVPGWVKNQRSFSEYEGNLRVVSSQRLETPNPKQPDQFLTESDNRLSVLRQQDNQLIQIGELTGIGPQEWIESIRFAGPLAYVVTFLRTDPLYVLDVLDPENPKLDGELQVPGYSAYLHPLGEDYLLGIGQDADNDGRSRGLQVSLFEVADPDHLRRSDHLTVAGAWSAVEWDHRAFLWWQPRQLLLAPYSNNYWDPASQQSFWDSGILAAQVEGGRILPQATLRHHSGGLLESQQQSTLPVWQTSALQRVVIIGDRVYTVSNGALGVHDLNSWQTLAVVPWPQ